MNDYKTTLNLPKTNFPMKGNLIEKEPEILVRWSNDDLYNVVRSTKKGKKLFLLHDGPPYANGNIHLGHSVNKILKDIIVKSKGFSGFDSPFVPGWDCHGLPIELKVEKKYGKPSDEFTAESFRTKCREYAAKQVDNQRKDFVRLGILGDWSHPYLTMDFKTEANIIRVLRKIINNGLLYRDIKPIHWCIDCRSALAESEIEYRNKISLSIDVTFKAVNQSFVRDVFNLNRVTGEISLIAWTTTPWTLPASRALSLSPTLFYSLVQLEDRALILAKNLVDSVMERINVKKYVVLSTINSKKLEMMRFKHPFLNFDVPVLLDSYVSPESGTGVVHIAGGHGQNDYKVSQKYKIEIVNPVGMDGTYLLKTHPLLDGINIFNVDSIIIDLLQKNNAFIHSEKMQHSYPFCWRHKTPIIFRATSQWFIGVNQKRFQAQMLKEIETVRWIPEWSKIRIKSMTINRPDWCVSRQRLWGVPMSLFINKETRELHPFTLEIMEEVARRVETKGVQAWWDFNLRDFFRINADLYEKVSDTLDVWFDSGSTHASVIDARSEFLGRTADIYLEGSDQHRGWFMSSLIVSAAMKKGAPYRQVLTHGFVVDAKGKKMSKSVGNTISPQDVINKLGADILRLWVASNNYASEMAISNEILERTTDKYRRIRNTVRFLLANTNDYNPVKNIVNPEEMVALDRLAVSLTMEAQEDIINAYETYDFHKVTERLIHFCSVEMCSFYFDIIKDRLYTLKTNSLARRSCQTALFHILEALVRWIAPIISFTADEVWSYLPDKRKKYVFCEEWYEGLFCLNELDLIDHVVWNELVKIRTEVNWLIEKARTDGKIKSSLEATIILYAKPELSEKLTILGSELRFFFLTSGVKITSYVDVITNTWQSKLIDGLKIELNKAEGKKCLRCWHYTTDVEDVGKYKNICARCTTNIVGDGEKRKFI